MDEANMIRMIDLTSVRLIAGLFIVAVAFHSGLSQDSSDSPPLRPKADLSVGPAVKAPASAPADESSRLPTMPTYTELQKQLDDLQERFTELHKQTTQAKDKIVWIKEALKKYHAEAAKSAAAAASQDSEKLRMLQKENASLKNELDKLKISNEGLGRTNLKYQTDIAVLEDKVKKLQESPVSPYVATRPAYPKPDLTGPPPDIVPPVSTRPIATTLPFSQPAVAPDMPIRAKVEAVERDIAVIDAGVSAGVKERVRLYIIRDGKVIATVKIMNVVGEMSSGIVEDKKQEVQKGDMAVSEIPTQ
ncbi:MAG: hypothetical protein HZA50_09160 [Planctomycetes bacterium]|nr:hypothetical protein [Planctomycetota bacterium]